MDTEYIKEAIAEAIEEGDIEGAIQLAETLKDIKAAQDSD